MSNPNYVFRKRLTKINTLKCRPREIHIYTIMSYEIGINNDRDNKAVHFIDLCFYCNDKIIKERKIVQIALPPLLMLPGLLNFLYGYNLLHFMNSV